MSTANTLVFLVLILILKINLNACNAATLPASGNSTEESTAMAKTSTTIMDAFEDIRWFFERLSIFCDMVERMLPPERKERVQPQLSVGVTLESGLRHFVYGVREISKSIVRVLSDKDVSEYKQISRATDFAHDMVKSVGGFFKDLRILIGNLFATYTFYFPEVLLSKCMGNYLLQTYPDRPLYEYPVLLINDIIDAFRTSETGLLGIVNESNRKLGSGSEINFDKNMEQNEILDDDMYVFHNTPISPSPELAVKKEEVAPDNEDDSTTFNVDSDLKDPFGLKEKLEASLAEVPSWKKCIQMYATETIFRKLEFYFLEMRE